MLIASLVPHAKTHCVAGPSPGSSLTILNGLQVGGSHIIYLIYRPVTGLQVGGCHIVKRPVL